MPCHLPSNGCCHKAIPSALYNMSNSDLITHSTLIKSIARQLGFDACGITKAIPVHPEMQQKLLSWLNKDYQAGMAYMDNHFEKRTNPCLLVEGTRSIVCVALNYYPSHSLPQEQLQFAYYAYGKDYHDIMRQKLTQMLERIQAQIPTAEGRAFCDTAPILERYWAEQAGLGWTGKNTQLIIPGKGSYFFLGELFLNIDLHYDKPMENHCGNCTRCLNACPTHALEAPRLLNANRCLSYLTIEHRGDIPKEAALMLGQRIYGCDSCQHACPHNRFASPHHTPAFNPSNDFLQMKADDWENLDIETYRKIFKGSAVKRAKYEGLMRNIHAQKR